MDTTAKQRVKDALVANAREELAAMRENLRSEDAAARIDQDSSFSVDDLSQSDEAGDFAGLLQQAIDRRTAELAELEAWDVSPREQVGPGAVVGFGGRRFVVGVTSGGVECDGFSYQGLSTDSPIYPHLEGCRAGEEFTFRERTHTVEFVA